MFRVILSLGWFMFRVILGLGQIMLRVRLNRLDFEVPVVNASKKS